MSVQFQGAILTFTHILFIFLSVKVFTIIEYIYLLVSVT